MNEVFAGSAGHNNIVQGANSAYGKEHVEARRFLDAVAHYVKSAGWTFVNCTDDVGRTGTQVWTNSANKHLKVFNSDIDLQLHLNSASPAATGVEVLYHPSYGNKQKAAALSAKLASAFGLRDRGAKPRTDLGWLNKTKTGLMPELAFISNGEDMKKFHANFDKAAREMAEFITGKSVNPSTPQQPSYRINIGDFDSIEWTAAAFTKVKELLPDYGVWTQCVEGGYHRIIVGDFNSKQWADDTMAKLKVLGYGMWIQSL